MHDGHGACGLDHARVVRGDHRVARARHEDPQAAQVGLVHLRLRRVRHRGRLGVGALDQPHPGARAGEVGGVGLGAAQRRLEHRADPRVLAAQVREDREGGVDRGVVLHVEGDGGARAGGRGADRGGVLEGDPVAVARQGLAERRELDRHLDGVRQAEVGEAVEQRDVGGAGGRGVGRVGDVLAEVVDGDQQAALDQRADRRRSRYRGRRPRRSDRRDAGTPGGW